MADYYPLIARAVDGLSDKSPAVRRAVYERARNALVAQLQSLQPPVAPADIDRERAALDLAIGSVEALYVLPSPQSPMEAAVLAEPSQTLLEPIKPERAHRPHVIAEIPGAPVSDEVAEEPFEDLQDPAQVIVERPRIGSKHHSSGHANRVRAIILVASVVAVVIGIASYKLYDRGRQTPPEVVTEQQGNEQPEGAPSETGKFGDRLGGGVVQETVAPKGGTEVATVAIQKAVLFEIDPATLSLPPSDHKIIASEGLTKWTLEQMDAGAGKPLETVVHGEVDFPQVGFNLDVQIRKNNDGSSVSHLVTLRFNHGTDDANHTVVNINKIEMKDGAVDPRGNVLSATPIPLATDLFLLGMSDIPSQLERNMQLLQSKNWFWIEVLFSNGQRGAVAIEKGPTGFQVIEEAMRTWQ